MTPEDLIYFGLDKPTSPKLGYASLADALGEMALTAAAAPGAAFDTASEAVRGGVNAVLPEGAVAKLEQSREWVKNFEEENPRALDLALMHSPLGMMASEGKGLLKALSEEARLARAAEQGYLTYGGLKDKLMKAIPDMTPERLALADRFAQLRLERMGIEDAWRKTPREARSEGAWQNMNDALDELGWRQYRIRHDILNDPIWLDSYVRVFQGANPEDLVTFYHGTGAGDISEGFAPELRGYGTGGESAKRATFATISPDEASRYAEWADHPRKNLRGSDLRKAQAEAKWAQRRLERAVGEAYSGVESGLVGSTQEWDDLMVKNPRLHAEIEKQKTIRDAMEDTASDLANSAAYKSSPNVIPLWVRADDINIVDKAGTGFGDITKNVMAGESAGKDATLFFDIMDPMKASTHIAVKDPSRFRVPWANFDPSMKDSANLLAGLTGAGLLSPYLMEEPD